jgi:hypothetical protein
MTARLVISNDNPAPVDKAARRLKPSTFKLATVDGQKVKRPALYWRDPKLAPGEHPADALKDTIGPSYWRPPLDPDLHRLSPHKRWSDVPPDELVTLTMPARDVDILFQGILSIGFACKQLASAIVAVHYGDSRAAGYAQQAIGSIASGCCSAETVHMRVTEQAVRNSPTARAAPAEKLKNRKAKASPDVRGKSR